MKDRIEEPAYGETAVERTNRITDMDREDRQERREERREQRPERVDKIRDEIEERHEDYHDDYYDDYRHVRVYATLPCTGETVVVNGVTYWRCSSTWYTRSFSGGDVIYVVVGAPVGY